MNNRQLTPSDHIFLGLLVTVFMLILLSIGSVMGGQQGMATFYLFTALAAALGLNLNMRSWLQKKPEPVEYSNEFSPWKGGDFTVVDQPVDTHSVTHLLSIVNMLASTNPGHRLANLHLWAQADKEAVLRYLRDTASFYKGMVSGLYLHGLPVDLEMKAGSDEQLARQYFLPHIIDGCYVELTQEQQDYYAHLIQVQETGCGGTDWPGEFLRNELHVKLGKNIQDYMYSEHKLSPSEQRWVEDYVDDAVRQHYS